MFPEYILMSCLWVATYLVRCVLVLRCGSASACTRIPHHPRRTTP